MSPSEQKIEISAAVFLAAYTGSMSFVSGADLDVAVAIRDQSLKNLGYMTNGQGHIVVPKDDASEDSQESIVRACRTIDEARRRVSGNIIAAAFPNKDDLREAELFLTQATVAAQSRIDNSDSVAREIVRMRPFDDLNIVQISKSIVDAALTDLPKEVSAKYPKFVLDIPGMR